MPVLGWVRQSTRPSLPHALRSAVGLGGLGNLLEGLACRFGAHMSGKVAKRYDADEALIAIDDRHAANLNILHDVHDLVRIVIVVAPAQILAHGLGSLGVGGIRAGRA